MRAQPVDASLCYRHQSLDAQLDLSMASYVATANDAKLLPDMLRDRFRNPHADASAGSLGRPDGERDGGSRARRRGRVGDPPLAPDELANIAKKWRGVGFSMRKLRSIVLATLEARDFCAPRH